MNKESKRKVEQAKKIANNTKKTSSFFDGVEFVIHRITRWFSSLIDSIFSSKKHLVLFSLFLAILMYLIVNVSENNLIISSLSSSKTLSNVSVTTKYNSELFEVSGIPNACSIVLTGEANNVNNAASKQGTCLINLEGYIEGSYKVKIEASGYGDSVMSTVTPTYADITLKKKTTRQFDLNYQFNNANLVDSKYIFGEPVFENGKKINIRASEDTLDSIEYVVAMIDVAGANEDFETEATIVAYRKGTHEKLDVEITPSKVKTKVKVSSPNKEVPISFVFVGSAPSGYSVNTVQLNQQNITIYASEDILAKINSIPVEIDLSKVTSSPEVTKTIELPEGVNTANISMITYKVSLDVTSSKVIENVPVIYKNNTNNYGASNVETTSVTVTIYGTENNIKNITANDIEVYIDVLGLSAGKHTLPLQYNTKSKFITLTLSQEKIDITLLEK